VPELTLTGALTAACIAQAGALVYVFKRMESLVKRGQEREDRLLSALLGKLDEDSPR
jgi:hypothetical protein